MSTRVYVHGKKNILRVYTSYIIGLALVYSFTLYVKKKKKL